ncbi:DUF3618 domain-containing protein [Rhodococcus sp. X156]|uniref:DUF3618 domain-containing protein n=1 Tax=Rhodococcus sp. X156 TaxID=2499145 RepID=UPI000FDC605D|nr:DUF3618 domain-containing protein [Rhodococcus sp. X156]
MARDTENIEREIERARDQLARTVDELTVRASPKRMIDNVKHTVLAKLEEPAVRNALIGVGAVVGVLVLRKIFR